MGVKEKLHSFFERYGINRVILIIVVSISCLIFATEMFVLTNGFHTHSFLERTIVSETCVNDGIVQRLCEKCDYMEERIIFSSGHAWKKEYDVIKATCRESGIAIYKCNKCGEIQERNEQANHLFVQNKCTVCEVVKSNQKADVWYELTSNNVFKFKNAEIKFATPVSQGKAYMVTYYPVCKNCHICGMVNMTGVGANTPITETYRCDYCDIITYVHFKVEY